MPGSGYNSEEMPHGTDEYVREKSPRSQRMQDRLETVGYYLGLAFMTLTLAYLMHLIFG